MQKEKSEIVEFNRSSTLRASKTGALLCPTSEIQSFFSSIHSFIAMNKKSLVQYSIFSIFSKKKKKLKSKPKIQEREIDWSLAEDEDESSEAESEPEPESDWSDFSGDEDEDEDEN